MAFCSQVSLLIWATWIQGFVSFAFYYILIAFDGRQGQDMNLLLAVGQVICQWNNWTWHAFANGYIFAQTTQWNHDFLPPFGQMSLVRSLRGLRWSSMQNWELSKSVSITFQHVPCTQLLLAWGVDVVEQESCVTNRGCGVDWGLGASRGEESHYKKKKQLGMIPGFNEPRWQICLLILQQNRQRQ